MFFKNSILPLLFQNFSYYFNQLLSNMLILVHVIHLLNFLGYLHFFLATNKESKISKSYAFVMAHSFLPALLKLGSSPGISLLASGLTLYIDAPASLTILRGKKRGISFSKLSAWSKKMNESD